MSARVVCISRAIWVGAEEMAAEVANALGFRMVDEGIITRAAQSRGIDPALVANAERRKSFFDQLMEDIGRGSELLGYLSDEQPAPTENEQLRTLIRDAIGEAAQAGNVVIVAHAASFALGMREDVLRVLITGSPFVRACRWLATSGGRSPEDAAETIRESDEARAEYLKRFYDIENESPEHYDLTVSTDVLTAAQAADLIVTAARLIGNRE